MFIKQLKLHQFRNYENIELHFDDKVNIFLGENAQGKTNALEAIYVLILAKSHRTSRDRELILWEKEFARIEGSFEKRTGPLTLELVLHGKGKKGKVNGLEQKRLSDYVGSANVVMFAPEDLNLVKGMPSIRRRFLDMEIGQMNRVYLHDLGLYQKVLKQRNHLLKEMQKNKQSSNSMLDIFTEQFIDLAAEVLSRRFLFVKRLRKWARDIHYSISNEKEELDIHYVPTAHVSEEMNLLKIKEGLYETYEKKREQEIFRGSTLFGPHRDDLTFTVNGRNLQTFGSQGQQRTTALALKLAEIELIHAEIGDYPILLLDDVLSELDRYRQSHLLKAMQEKVQTFITTTSVSGIDEEMIKEAKIFRVSNGTIETE